MRAPVVRWHWVRVFRESRSRIRGPAVQCRSSIQQPLIHQCAHRARSRDRHSGQCTSPYLCRRWARNIPAGDPDRRCCAQPLRISGKARRRPWRTRRSSSLCRHSCSDAMSAPNPSLRHLCRSENGSSIRHRAPIRLDRWRAWSRCLLAPSDLLSRENSHHPKVNANAWTSASKNSMLNACSPTLPV